MPGLETITLAIIASIGTTSVLASNILYFGIQALALAGLAYGSSLLVSKPSVPKPEDGSYNLKQSVPSDSYVLGWAKKGGDYVFLEERNGTAYHIVVAASHEIDGYIQHYLHDEKTTLDIDGYVTSPVHFKPGSTPFVKILERTGLSAGTAYSDIVMTFPEIWSNDHRGDGLASIMMSCRGSDSKDYMSVYPNQMPQWSGVVAGAKLYDPRTSLTTFSRNLALMRFWHLTRPVGGKLSLDEMYLPDFINAANVCDQTVVNRDGDDESRYYGGFWFRANNDPTEVGRIIDQAGELVVYERPDGLVGIHAGEFVEPDITLTRNDVISFQLDANARDTSNVLAVRGRYSRLDLDYNLSDAAIYGDPYIDGDDTERTKTTENSAVQSHNHVQRLQKIAFIRANAPRVAIKAHYEPAENVPYRRFVRVNIPPKLDNVIVEITETPKLSLRNLTIDFSGIIVPANLYAFDALTEEGDPGNDIVLLENGGAPTPTDFDVVIQADVVSGTTKAGYGLATWTHVNDDLTYEFQWQPTDESEPPRSLMSEPGEDEVRSGYLKDGVQYRFRLRAWGGGTQSEWTDYETLTVVIDPVAPKTLTSFTAASIGPHYGQAPFAFTTKSDSHLAGIAIYRTASGGAFDPDTDFVKVIPALPGMTFSATLGDAPTNLATNGDFAVAGPPPTLGPNWTITAGHADHSAGTGGSISWGSLTLAVANVIRYGFTINSISGASAALTPRITGGTTVTGTALTTSGFKSGSLTAVSGNNTFGMLASTNAVVQIDNVTAFISTIDQEPAGVWDYRAVPVNGSAIPAATVSGPLTITVI